MNKQTNDNDNKQTNDNKKTSIMVELIDNGRDDLNRTHVAINVIFITSGNLFGKICIKL